MVRGARGTELARRTLRLGGACSRGVDWAIRAAVLQGRRGCESGLPGGGVWTVLDMPCTYRHSEMMSRVAVVFRCFVLSCTHEQHVRCSQSGRRVYCHGLLTTLFAVRLNATPDREDVHTADSDHNVSYHSRTEVCAPREPSVPVASQQKRERERESMGEYVVHVQWDSSLSAPGWVAASICPAARVAVHLIINETTSHTYDS